MFSLCLWCLRSESGWLCGLNDHALVTGPPPPSSTQNQAFSLCVKKRTFRLCHPTQSPHKHILPTHYSSTSLDLALLKPQLWLNTTAVSTPPTALQLITAAGVDAVNALTVTIFAASRGQTICCPILSQQQHVRQRAPQHNVEQTPVTGCCCCCCSQQPQL